MSTSIGIQFNVNDLNAHYEVIGTSDNYSFQHNIGIGSSLVDQEGDVVNKNISLQGNYGIFDVRVFAVSNIGVRSPSLTGVIEITPPEMEGTFTFNNLRIEDINDATIGSQVIQSPDSPGDTLLVSSEFFGKNIDLSWELIPPAGHSQEGESLAEALLSDTFFSGFRFEIRDGGQLIDLSNLDDTNEALISLSEPLSTSPGNVNNLLNNLRQFNLTINEDVFDGLNLSREPEFTIVSVDKFGNEASGIIQAKNYEPLVQNLTYNIVGSEVLFFWFVQDSDFVDMKINYLGIPSNEYIKYPNDLQASINYYREISEAKSYNDFYQAKYFVGDKVVYKNNVYECIKNHSRENLENPSNSSENWLLIGDKIPYFK